MKEQYLALMDRTFDAYGADGETVTTAMTADASDRELRPFVYPRRTELKKQHTDRRRGAAFVWGQKGAPGVFGVSAGEMPNSFR